MTPRRPIYDGRIVRLGIERVRLPDGRQVELEMIRHPGAAAVLPLFEDGRVRLVRQYRHGGGGMMLEVPAGVLEPGERPEDTAARELAEEVQLAAGRLVPLGAIHTTPGFTDERIHLFLGLELRPVEGRPDADEHLEPLELPFAEALRRARAGEITDAKTLCALFLAEPLARAEARARP